MQRSVLLAIALTACGGSDDSAQTPGAESPAPAEVSFDFDELPALFSDRIPPPTDAVAAEMAKRRPTADYWPSELDAEAAEVRLSRLLEAGSLALRPAATEEVFADASTRVQRASDLTGELVPLGPCAEVQVRVTAVRSGPEEVETTAVAQLYWALEPAQTSLTFESTWTRSDDGLDLGEVRLTDFEEVRTENLLFADVTMNAFGANEFYASEFNRGIDDYYMRIDRRAGTAFQGMQGLAVGDVDGDGLEDVYACQQVGLPNRLFLHAADGTARDNAVEAKVNYLDVTRTVLIVDLDNDGDQDLAQAIGPLLVIAYNGGGGQFDEQVVLTHEGQEQIYSLSAADADNDGDLDLYAGRYALEGVMHGVPTPYYDANNGATNAYWRNDGERTFTNATAESGFGASNTKFTLASLFEDFDEDGDLDLYVVNDFGRNNLFQNDGTGHFVDVAAESGAVDIGAGMGATVGDFDLDGDQDLYVTNMWSAPGLRISGQSERFMEGAHADVHRWFYQHAGGNSLLRNRGDGTFEDVTDEAHVAVGRWGWGGLFTDFNNDGLDDLYVPCGHATNRRSSEDLEAYFWHRVISSSPPDASPKEQYANAFGAVHRMVMYEDVSWNGSEPNLAYLNLGSPRFADVSAVSGADLPDDSRAAALIDWDEDGRVDLLVKSRNAPRLRLLRNTSSADGGWIAFELVGNGTTTNRDGIGARVSVELEGRTLRRRLQAGSGYLAQSSKRLHFGLGAATAAARVVVEWPDGSRDEHPDLTGGRRWRLVQGSASAEEVESRSRKTEATFADPHAAAWNPTPVTRVVAADRLPMAAFAAPSFKKGARRLHQLGGRPTFVMLWTAEHEGGEAALAALSRSAADKKSVKLRVVPLSTDEGPGLARARALTDRYGFSGQAGFADGRVLESYEMALLEVLGFFQKVPAPTGLLLDANAQLAVVYLGPPDVDTLLADVETLGTIKSPRGTARLVDGRWLVRRQRGYDELAQVFDARGHTEIAEFYTQLAAQIGR
jgi:hypothetical protein